MFEPIVSPIPGLNRQLNIFSIYQVHDWLGSDLTRFSIVAGKVDAQHIMAWCTYNTCLLFSDPYTYVSQYTKKTPDGYLTNSVMFLLIFISCILTISKWMGIFYAILWEIKSISHHSRITVREIYLW